MASIPTEIARMEMLGGSRPARHAHSAAPFKARRKNARNSDHFTTVCPAMSPPRASASRQSGKDKDPAFAGTLPRDLVRARAWLRAHLREPVRLDVLAQVAGVAPRTLETHFRQFLGTTPLGWVRQERLLHARRALLDQTDGTSITRIALDSGFTQLGRFAARYNRQFGELPSQTVQRARANNRDDIDDEALRLTWRAMPSVFAVAPRQCNAALEDLDRAQQLAPGFGLPKAMAAWCWGQRAAQHFSATPQEDAARALRLADEAQALAPTDPMTLTLVSGALTLTHRLEAADRLLEKALAYDPWSAVAWLRRGWSSAYLGDPESAIREFGTTLQIMPFEPLRHLAFIGIGCAHFAAGRYAHAARWVQAGIEACPESFWAARVMAAAAIHAGARSEGRRIVRQLLRKDPSLTVAVAQRAWPFPPRFMACLADGLIAAGMPRN
jgi:AraC-like DNA-binding protein